MALKILKKDEQKPEPPRLPEGGDRFLWSEIPKPAKKIEYAQILKGQKRAT
jgi:hypothetical protein